MEISTRTNAASRRACALAFAAVSALAVASQTLAQDVKQDAKDGNNEIIDRVIVTAQKKEENLIDVPIAVSTFDAIALERRQINQATDLQLNVPNIAYSKTNFAGSNLQIRGIGVSSVGASSDSGVETHFNFVPLKNPRLFETEYFDIERVEVLRGPQGTLYGRNATGGVVNVLPKQPINGEFSGNVELEAGNYNEMKAKGAINLPLGNKASMRFAAIGYQRDGYTENLYTGNDIDGRDQWAARGALRVSPGEDTDIILTVNYYDEDSSRSRTTKQMCHRDPAGAYGCLPDRLGFETGNLRGTLAGNLAEFGPLLLDLADGAVNNRFYGAPIPPQLILTGTNLNQGAIVPADLHKTYAEFDPTYQADETIATLALVHDFGSLTLTSLTGYQQTTFVGRTDYNGSVAGLPYNGPAVALLTGVFGGVPISQIDDSLLGSLNGAIRSVSDRSQNYDQSDQDANQWSQELRLSSDFDGPLDFLLGAFYFDTKAAENYYVVTSELDYWAQVTRPYAAFGVGSAPPYYINSTPSATLKSTALFGELYWDMTDQFKWTAGLRWTRDEKAIRDRQMLFAVPATNTTFRDFRVDETTFSEFTGRFGFDWKPGWFEDSTLYAFYSRGYKAGGFNPPAQGNVAFAGAPTVYDPEFVNAFEVGSKNVLAGGRVRANLTAFYYDYKGLQVSKVLARTSVNENVDAKIYGIEGEFVLSPVDDFVVDANLAYLKTQVQDFASIDPRDVSNGDPNWTTIKNIQDGSNCALPTVALPAARGAGLVLPAATGGPFGVCAPLRQSFGATDGVAADLSGNQLSLSPQWSFKVGAQYTLRLANGLQITPRLDYYWRDDFYGRIYNKPIDRIASWDLMNAQVDLAGVSESWYLRGYVNNIMDDDNITGMHVSDASSGLFTNVFALEPRTYGVALGLRF